jgi:hypothetical protein
VGQILPPVLLFLLRHLGKYFPGHDDRVPDTPLVTNTEVEQMSRLKRYLETRDGICPVTPARPEPCEDECVLEGINGCPGTPNRGIRRIIAEAMAYRKPKGERPRHCARRKNLPRETRMCARRRYGEIVPALWGS